ncbi:hypothetical protein B0H14DRAFT_2584922 [Mycena olivaceomarginata]|nr:hypothetical protein B0H14DRAFT_2584922 [Mycena olivaceomarginata]
MYPYPVLGAFCFLHRYRLDSWLHIANSDSDSFTAGTPAMCGHAQGENCMNKLIGEIHSTTQLFNGLNECSENQSTDELIQSHQALLIHLDIEPSEHVSVIIPLSMLFLGKFTTQLSLFHKTEVFQLPNEVKSRIRRRNFVYFTKPRFFDCPTKRNHGTATLCEFVKNMLLSGSVAWSLSARKIFLTCLQHKINTFVNDHATVSLKWLLDQVIKRGLDVGHLRVKHKATGAIQTKEVQSASKETGESTTPQKCTSRGESLMHLMRGAPGSTEVCATTCASPRRLVLYSHFLAHARTLPISTTPNNTKGAPPPLSGLHRQRQEHPHVEAECIRAAALRKAGIEPHNTIDRYPQPVKHPARIVAGKWPPRRSSGVASSRASSIDCISVYPLALEGIDLFDHPLARRIAVGHVAACVYVLYLKGMAPIDTPDVFPLKLTGMCEVEDVLPEPQLSILSV